MTAIQEVFSRLNPQQRQAACAGRDPLLIIAGAGTGKTTTLAHRVAWLIANDTPPEQILLLTFTRRAAAEMLRRVDGILRELGDGETRTAQLASRRVTGGTFHAVASRLLRRHGKLIGLPAEFSIQDRGDSEDLIQVIRTELKLASDSEARFPLKGTCLSIYSRTVNAQRSLSKVLEESFPWCKEHEEKLGSLFRAYVERKESLGILDYDDLLLFFRALARHEEAGPLLRDRYQCVLVDEYQDTNAVQADILTGLCPDGQGLTVVGDDAQAIYSFRAATVRNILDFPKQFENVQVLPLEQNYRSTPSILAAANRVISAAKERHQKELWSDREDGQPPQLVFCEDDDEQTDFLIERMLEHRENGIPLQKQAVLSRASHHSIGLEAELTRRNIPFHKYGGLKFIETAHVKDLLAFLRLADNPRDVVSGMRTLMLLPGIGQKRAGTLLAQLDTARGDFRCWKDFTPPAASREHWPLFVALLVLLSRPESRRQALGDQIGQIRRFYGPLMERKYDDARSRARDLDSVQHVASRFKSRAEFLSEMTLDPPASTQDLAGDPFLDEDYLILSTIHSAKGLEWNVVSVIHAADGNIPSDMATDSPEQIEEERRLFYVALTRAKDWLYVCCPQRYYIHGQYRGDSYSFAQVTRFLTPHAQQCFDPVVPGFAGDDEPSADSTSTNEIRSGLNDLWK